MPGITEELKNEIEYAIERVKVLAAEGNTEGVESVASETETMISGIKGTGSVAMRKQYRDMLGEARDTKPTPKQGEIVKAATPEVEVASVPWLVELVNKGSDQVRMIAETKVRGGRAVAAVLLDIRRRITGADGLPDLKGATHLAKTASSQVYNQILSQLDENETDLREEIAKIQREVRNVMTDVRVEYIRSLNQEGEDSEAERALFVSVERKPDESFADAVARHYGIRLMTRAEIAAADRAAKAALEAGGDESDADSDEGESGGDDSADAPASLRRALAEVANNIGIIRTIADSQDLANEDGADEAGQIIDDMLDALAELRAKFA